MRKAADISFRFLILVVLIITFALVVDWFDPWAFAASRVRAELTDNPDLERHLQEYGIVARSARDWLVVPVSCAQLVVVTVDSALGEALWEEALSLAGEKPGGRALLETINTLSHDLVELDREIAGVVRLSATAQDLVNLREGTTPSPEALEAIGTRCREGTNCLVAIDQRVVSAAEDIERLEDLQASQNILATLDEWRAVWMWPFNRLVDLASEGVSSWFGLDDRLRSLHGILSRDIQTLTCISHWITAAQITETVLTAIRVRELASWVLERQSIFLSLLVLFLALWAGLRTGDFLAERARWRALTRRGETKIVIVQPRRQEHPVGAEPRERRRASPSLSRHSPASQSIARPRLQGALILIRPDGTRQTFPLPAEGKITVGRGEANEIVIAEPSVVEYHLMVGAARSSYFVQPLSNLASVLLNGQPITGARRLQHGDTLHIGSYRLTFLQR